MTRHNLVAVLYVPLRVALFETENGDVVFEYDRPSTLFGQFGDERIWKSGSVSTENGKPYSSRRPAERRSARIRLSATGKRTTRVMPLTMSGGSLPHSAHTRNAP